MRVVIRYRAARSRLARFVTGSLAAHGILAAIVLVVPMMHRAPATFDDAMVVALAGPLPGPAAAPAAVAPRQPAAPPPPEEAHTVREVPKPQPKATPAPKKKEEPVKSPAPAPVPSTPPQPDTPVDRPPSDEPQAGPGGTGGGGGGPTGVTATLGGGGDASLGFYGAAVKAALESAWIKPYLEEQGETYSVSVSFVIARDGSTRDVRIATASGVPSLDRSALRAVIEASPLPPIPPTWQSDSLPATMRFDLTPEGR